MTCVNGNLRKVIFNGKNECLFKVPNFCICDPLFERDYNDIKEHSIEIVEKDIIVIIYYIDDKNETKEKKIENITNKTMALNLKKKFAEMAGIDMDNNKIRLFYKGFELLDDSLLWYDKIENMAKIQCLVTNIEAEIK